MAIVPSAPRVHSNPDTMLTVDPLILSGDPGDMFTVTVYVSDVMDLVAYDVQLDYNTAAISATCEFDAGTVFDGMPVFVVPEGTICDDPTGVARSSRSLLGGVTKDVFAPQPVMILTFTVDSTQDSDLAINPGSILVQLIGGDTVPVPYGIVNSVFLAPPTAQLHRWDASVSPSDRNKFLSRGETSVTLVGTVRMTNKAIRGGYAFVTFDVIGPDGSPVATLDSNTVFVNPGEIVDVSALYDFPSTQGRYELFATLHRGASLDFFVSGESTSGLHFFVHF